MGNESAPNATSETDYDDIFGGGEEVTHEESTTSTAEETAKSGEETSSTETKTGATGTPGTGLDLSQLSSVVSETVKSTLAASKGEPKEEQKQLSPEEVRQILRVWEPGDDFIQKLHNPETAKAAVLELRQGLIGQAMAMAKVMLQGELSQIRQHYDGRLTEFDGRIQPVLKNVEQSSAKELYGSFTQTYPTFADERYRPVLQTVTQLLKAEGYKPKDQAELFDTIAERAQSILRAGNPEFTVAKANAQTKQTTKSTMPKLPTSSRGGGGGSSQASGQKVQGPPGTEIFD